MEIHRDVLQGVARVRRHQLGERGFFCCLPCNDDLNKSANSNRINLFNRKISAHEFERGGLLKPIVNTIDGTPTFLSVCPPNEMVSGTHSNQMNSTSSHPNRPQRLSRNELKHLDEKQLIFELVRYCICLPFTSISLYMQSSNLIHFNIRRMCEWN